MEVNMKVHRVSMTTAAMEAQIAGETTTVQVPRLEVELVSVDGQHGTMVLRFTRPSEVAAAREKFVQDADIVFSM